MKTESPNETKGGCSPWGEGLFEGLFIVTMGRLSFQPPLKMDSHIAFYTSFLSDSCDHYQSTHKNSDGDRYLDLYHCGGDCNAESLPITDLSTNLKLPPINPYNLHSPHPLFTPLDASDSCALRNETQLPGIQNLLTVTRYSSSPALYKENPSPHRSQAQAFRRTVSEGDYFGNRVHFLKLPIQTHSLPMNGRSKRHICGVCQKKFTRPSSLKIHILSHTGEKPYVCDVPGCSKRFSVLSNLRRHYKVHFSA